MISAEPHVLLQDPASFTWRSLGHIRSSVKSSCVCCCSGWCTDEIMQIKTVLVLPPGKGDARNSCLPSAGLVALGCLSLVVKVTISSVTNVTESDPPLSSSQVVCGDT